METENPYTNLLPKEYLSLYNVYAYDPSFEKYFTELCYLLF